VCVCFRVFVSVYFTHNICLPRPGSKGGSTNLKRWGVNVLEGGGGRGQCSKNTKLWNMWGVQDPPAPMMAPPLPGSLTKVWYGTCRSTEKSWIQFSVAPPGYSNSFEHMCLIYLHWSRYSSSEYETAVNLLIIYSFIHSMCVLSGSMLAL